MFESTRNARIRATVVVGTITCNVAPDGAPAMLNKLVQKDNGNNTIDKQVNSRTSSAYRELARDSESCM